MLKKSNDTPQYPRLNEDYYRLSVIEIPKIYFSKVLYIKVYLQYKTLRYIFLRYLNTRVYVTKILGYKGLTP